MTSRGREHTETTREVRERLRTTVLRET